MSHRGGMAMPTFYLDSGDTDGDTDIEPATLAVDKHMHALGLDPELYIDHGGSHDESSWGARFDVPMRNMFPPRVTNATKDVAP